MKTIKNILAFAFNEEAGLLCSFILVLSVTACVWFIPVWFIPVCVLPCNYFDPMMITLCAILVVIALRLFVVVYKQS